MVTAGTHFDILPDKEKVRVTSTTKKVQEKKYKKFIDNDLFKKAVEWYKSSDLVRHVCNVGPIHFNSLQRHLKVSLLVGMKERKDPLDSAAVVFKNYLSQERMNVSNRPNIAHASNRYLTEDEELQVVAMIREMAAMGFGVMKLVK